MKIRSDFVTNSSSSSFVIAVKDLDLSCSLNDKQDNKKYGKIINEVFSSIKNSFENVRSKAESLHEFENKFIEDFFYNFTNKEELDEYELKQYNEFLKLINNGFYLYYYYLDEYEDKEHINNLKLLELICEKEKYILADGYIE